MDAKKERQGGTHVSGSFTCDVRGYKDGVAGTHLSKNCLKKLSLMTLFRASLKKQRLGNSGLILKNPKKSLSKEAKILVFSRFLGFFGINRFPAFGKNWSFWFFLKIVWNNLLRSFREFFWVLLKNHWKLKKNIRNVAILYL